MRAVVILLSCFAVLLVTGCTLVKVVDTAASASISVATGAVKTTGKIIDVAVPDGEKSEKESE